MTKEKYCPKCELTKISKFFGKSTKIKDGLQCWCRDCFKIYREENKERIKAKEKIKYTINGDVIRERTRKRRADNKELFAEKDRIYRLENIERLTEQDAERNRKFKSEVFSHYGTKCECCGEQFMELLTIDHTNGGGSLHRKEVGYGQNFYKWLRDNNFPKEGFRVLCMNCNHSYGIRGYCPHQDGTKFKSVRD